MANRDNGKLLEQLIALLELPGSAYEKAEKRYQDIGEWLGREESTCASNEPHIFPQGSFRLGTAIRPLNGNEKYDLDLACNLRSGISSATHSQEYLKLLVGNELEAYRCARSIKSPLKEKHRCWRLEYADDLSFHMDIVPCIPEPETKRKSLAVAMESHGIEHALAQSVAELAVGITDDRHPNYSESNTDWMISNPEGYAKWFESRMRETSLFKAAMEAAQVDDIPIYQRKTPLQRVVQLLKRHRDEMFSKESDSKPISVIITTLSAQSYSGTSSVEAALREVLNGLNQFVESNDDSVPNPVNPEENFADRWSMPQYAHLNLKQNFEHWVKNATRDFEFVFTTEDVNLLTESINQNFAVHMSEDHVEDALGIKTILGSLHTQSPKKVVQTLSKPWYREE